MARIVGPIQFTGKLGDLSAYYTQDGLIVREKWGPDKKRMKSDPAFKGVYHQSLEFGNCAKNASQLRNALNPMILQTCDNRLTPRLNQAMNSIKNLDRVSVPGKRTVINGLLHPESREILKRFNLNINAGIGRILGGCYRLNVRDECIEFSGSDLKNALKAPQWHNILLLKRGKRSLILPRRLIVGRRTRFS